MSKTKCRPNISPLTRTSMEILAKTQCYLLLSIPPLHPLPTTGPTQFYERVAEEALRDIPEVHMDRIPQTRPTKIRSDPELKSRAKVVFTDTSKGAGGQEVCTWVHCHTQY